MLKVYGRANSINVRRVLWMLDEVGERFEREDWGRGYRPTDDPEFRKINPVGVVPVIDEGDFRLRESNANGMRPVFHGLIVKNPAFVNQVAAGAKEWAGQMQVLEDHLAQSGPYVMGKSFTVADIPVGLVVNRWYAIEFDKPHFAAVSAYYDRLAERPGYKAHGRNGLP
jgi:glutathione S-transferase